MNTPFSAPGAVPDSQQVLNQLLVDYMKEQKRRHRWRWSLRILIILLLMFTFFKVSTIVDDETVGRDNPHIGLVDLNGTIFTRQPAGSEDFVSGLETAYKSKGLKALVIRINSAGGSPVQADYMFNAIQYYRKVHPGIKVYAVCMDICASAAYYVAAAADDIYANESSLVGSIGVLYNGFGFVDTLEKLGMTRRLQTAGGKKAFLDPFSPSEPENKVFLQGILNEIHQQFIARVKQGRGARLTIDDQTFSGLFWSGKQARDRGLIDGFASSGQLARDIIKLDKFIDYTHKEGMFLRVSKSMGTAIVNQLLLALGLAPGITT